MVTCSELSTSVVCCEAGVSDEGQELLEQISSQVAIAIEKLGLK
jgi:hypothetical protein